jgi:hypothetical protein
MGKRCPICKRPLPPASDPASRYRPFCSQRCQLIDLGVWLDEGYTVPSENEPRQEEAGREEPEPQE